MKITNLVIRVILLVSLLGMLLLTGCMVAKSKYDTTKADYDTLQAKYNTLQADYDELYDSCSELADVSQEVLDVLEKFPPGDFTSMSDLRGFVNENIQPRGHTLEELFRSALKVQNEGYWNGYAISVMYNEDETDPGKGWIYCSALVNGVLYVWYPYDATVYDDYSFLTR